MYPVFRCPTRDVTTKIDGINSFTFNPSDNFLGFCLTEPESEISTIDPDRNCTDPERRLPFSQCKNNCPGGEFNDHLDCSANIITNQLV